MSTPMRFKFVAQNMVEKSDGTFSPYIGLEHVESGTGRLANEPEEKAASDSLIAEADDVLFGKLRPYLAKTFRVRRPLTCSGEFLVLRPRPGFHTRFIEYVTRSQPWLAWADATSYGSKMPRTSWDFMGDLVTHVPPIEQQRVIADFLDRETAKIDALIGKQEQLIAALREDRAATITHAVTKGLNPNVAMKASGVQWISEIPETWNVLRLSWMFATISSGTTPDSKNLNYYGGEINWVTTGELREEYVENTTSRVTDLALADHSALRIYEPGSLVIAMYGATIGRLGILSAPACTNQACCVFSKPKRTDVRFIYYIFQAAREHLLVLASGGGAAEH